MYESEGIRHIEIHRKTKKQFSSSEEDDTKEVYHPEQSQLLRADSDQISLDSILKAVINIGDRLDQQEEKLKLHEYNGAKQTSSSKHKKKRHDRMNPETAVYKYTREDSFSSGSDCDFEQSQSSSKLSSKLSARGRIHMGTFSRPPIDVFAERRKNMSFTNDSVKKIDAENQRLLKEILHTKSTTLNQRKRNTARPTSASAINRLRKQKDIERENLRLLNRLQSVKATNSLTRNSLLSEHYKNLEHTNRISKTTLKSRPTSAPVLRSTKGRHLNTFDNESIVSNSTSTSAFSGKRSLSASTRKKKVYNVFEPGW